MPLEDIERPERYHPGGYHPIVIGDRLNDRYDVVHKLGFGTYSTTWLARDRKTKKYVAIKIAIADADMKESEILGSLALSDLNEEGHPGKALIPQVLDKFLIDGPNGRHRCLVTEPGMMSLDGKPLPGGVPTHGVVPIWLGKESERVTITEAKIFLTDFGESFLPTMTERRYSNAPDILVPPEIYFLPCEPVSFSSDIWTLACTIWDIIGQRPLFEGFNPSKDWMIKG